MTPTERILALALAAIDDDDARRVLNDAMLEFDWWSPTMHLDGGRWWDDGAAMRLYRRGDHVGSGMAKAIAAVLLCEGWHNPDAPSEAEPWHVVERCQGMWRQLTAAHAEWIAYDFEAIRSRR